MCVPKNLANRCTDMGILYSVASLGPGKVFGEPPPSQVKSPLEKKIKRLKIILVTIFISSFVEK